MGDARSEELTAWRDAYVDDAENVRAPTRVPELVDALELSVALRTLSPARYLELTRAERTVARVRRVLHGVTDPSDLRRALLEAIEHE